MGRGVWSCVPGGLACGGRGGRWQKGSSWTRLEWPGLGRGGESIDGRPWCVRRRNRLDRAATPRVFDLMGFVPSRRLCQRPLEVSNRSSGGFASACTLHPLALRSELSTHRADGPIPTRNLAPPFRWLPRSRTEDELKGLPAPFGDDIRLGRVKFRRARFRRHLYQKFSTVCQR